MKTEQLLRKIEKEFPEIKWKKIRTTRNNWDYFVFVLSNKYVFRFAKDKEGAKKLNNEIKLLDYLKQKAPISVPDYIYRAKDKSFGGYKIIKGGKIMPKEFKKLSLENKKKIAKQFADFLKVLHAIPKRMFKKFGVETKENSTGDDKLFNRIRKTVFPKLSKKETDDIEKFFAEYKLMTKKPYKKVLVHGDFTKENMIYQKGKITGIIDFGDFNIGEPALDFKGFWDFGEEFVEMVYKKYNDNNDKLFLERSKLYFRIIGLYILDGAVNYKHCPCNFTEGHKRFREIFYI